MSSKTYEELENDLLSFVSDACPGIELEVENNPRWDRLCFTFRWNGFAGLLLEERFRKVARLIPCDYFENHCHHAVWLEMTADESINEYLDQPRSEDVDEALPEIWERLGEIEFFARLEDELVRIPPAECPDDLTISKRVLRASNLSDDEVRTCCLAFIRNEAYTDWEVLKKVRSIAESARPSSAKTKKGKTG